MTRAGGVRHQRRPAAGVAVLRQQPEPRPGRRQRQQRHRAQRRRGRRPPDRARRRAATRSPPSAGRRCPSARRPRSPGATAVTARAPTAPARWRCATSAWPTASSMPSCSPGPSDRLPTPAAGQPGSPGSNEAVIDLANVGVRDDGDAHPVRHHPEHEATHARRCRRSSRSRSTPTVTATSSTSPTTTTTRRSSRSTVARWCSPAPGARRPRYGPVDADIDSANMIYTVPLSPLGLVPGQTFSFRVLAFDRYFTGHLEDSINDMKYTVGSPRFRLAGGDTFSVPAHATSAVATVASDAAAGPSTAAGLLLLYRVNGGSESSVVTVSSRRGRSQRARPVRDGGTGADRPLGRHHRGRRRRHRRRRAWPATGRSTPSCASPRSRSCSPPTPPSWPSRRARSPSTTPSASPAPPCATSSPTPAATASTAAAHPGAAAGGASTRTPASSCWPPTSRPRAGLPFADLPRRGRARARSACRRRRCRGSPAHQLHSTVDRPRRLRPRAPGPDARRPRPRWPRPPRCSSRASAACCRASAGSSPLDWGLGFELRDAKRPHWTGRRELAGAPSATSVAPAPSCGSIPAAGIGLVVLTDRDFGPWALDAWPPLSDAVLAAVEPVTSRRQFVRLANGDDRHGARRRGPRGERRRRAAGAAGGRLTGPAPPSWRPTSGSSSGAWPGRCARPTTAASPRRSCRRCRPSTRSGSVRLGDLAAAERVTSPTLTKIVANLEAAGLVHRSADPDDRRAAPGLPHRRRAQPPEAPAHRAQRLPPAAPGRP